MDFFRVYLGLNRSKHYGSISDALAIRLTKEMLNDIRIIDKERVTASIAEP